MAEADEAAKDATDGAITGWAFTNENMPAERRMLAIARAVRTPLPDVLQAGQWTYSPSGVPIAILTGKLAADAANGMGTIYLPTGELRIDGSAQIGAQAAYTAIVAETVQAPARATT